MSYVSFSSATPVLLPKFVNQSSEAYTLDCTPDYTLDYTLDDTVVLELQMLYWPQHCSWLCVDQVWQLGSNTANFTLEGHEAGVNCVAYYYGGDKPYLLSGGDDRRVKIWDYQNKTCVQTLKGHAHNVSCVAFHPELPLIISGSEDGKKIDK